MNVYQSTKELLYKRFNKLLLTKKEVSEVLGISLSTIDNMIHNEVNYFPRSYKFGNKESKGTIRFSINDIALYVSSHNEQKENNNEK